eukprot:9013608-Pyramimonas_sp.AAC.1
MPNRTYTASLTHHSSHHIAGTAQVAPRSLHDMARTTRVVPRIFRRVAYNSHCTPRVSHRPSEHQKQPRTHMSTVHHITPEFDACKHTYSFQSLPPWAPNGYVVQNKWCTPGWARHVVQVYVVQHRSCNACCILYVVQPTSCNQYRTTCAMKPRVCRLCGAAYVAHCRAIYVVHPVWCNICCALYNENVY